MVGNLPKYFLITVGSKGLAIDFGDFMAHWEFSGWFLLNGKRKIQKKLLTFISDFLCL